METATSVTEIRLYQLLRKLDTKETTFNEQDAEETVKLIRDLKNEGRDQLVTKDFLQSELKSTKLAMIFWYIGISAVQTGTLLGFLYFILKH